MTKDKSLPPTPRHPLRSRTATVLMTVALLVGCIFAARLLRPATDADAIELPVVTNQGVGDGSVPDRISQAEIDNAEHPFDPLLVLAESCLEKIDREVEDYTAVMTSQVRTDGTLNNPRKMFCKIRHPKNIEGDKCTFSVYTKFMEPESVQGQEAIWVDGWHDGNIVAHLSRFNFKRFYIPPDSSHAMAGNLHPISDIGFRQLLAKMCEVAKNDREYGECEVTVTKGLEIDGRRCTMLEAKHPVKRDHFEFHIARIYIDNEAEFPLAYEGYLWPETEGGEPVLLEKYYYSEVKLNVGLKDIDFDPANEEYNYPSF